MAAALGAVATMTLPSAEARADTPVTFSGFAQVDLRTRQSSQDEINPSTGEPLNEDGVFVRRAFLRAEVERGVAAGVFEVEARTIRGPELRPGTMEVQLRWPEGLRPGDPPLLVTRAGLFRTPFGHEVEEVPRDRPFLERSAFAAAFFPDSFDAGIRIDGAYKFIRTTVAAMNGQPLDSARFPLRDPTAQKDLILRMGVVTPSSDVFRVEGNVTLLTGQGLHVGEQPTKDQLVFRDANEDGVVDEDEIAYVPGAPGTASQKFKRFAVGADVRVYIKLPAVGELALRAEIARGSNLDRGLVVADPIARGRDLRELGYAIGLSQELFRYGLVGVRYDAYDPDTDAQERAGVAVVPRDLTVRTTALVAGVVLPDPGKRRARARLLAEYDVVDNAFGRSANGAPARLADNAFTLRGEVGF